MRSQNLRTTAQAISLVLRSSGDAAREARDVRRAIKRMPKPMPWAWAAPRLVPLLAGPSIDDPVEPLVRVRSELGPMVQFGVDLGGAFAFVDAPVAERWECRPDQLMERAMENVRTWSARIPATEVRVGVMSGRSIRLLIDRPPWASSIVLVPEAVFRLFGDHDQILGTPRTSCLVSLPTDTPPAIVADIIVDFEESALRSLWLDPFVIIDGRIVWTDDLEASDDTA